MRGGKLAGHIEARERILLEIVKEGKRAVSEGEMYGVRRFCFCKSGVMGMFKYFWERS